MYMCDHACVFMSIKFARCAAVEPCKTDAHSLWLVNMLMSKD